MGTAIETLVAPGGATPYDEAVAQDPGDIHGAFGTVPQHPSAGRPRSLRARVLTLLAIMGPGLIVMVGDNDAGGVATYAQAGQNYGTSLLWTLLLLVPVLIVNQDMCLRLGAVTGVGHAKLVFERFGKFWGAFSVADLFVLNFLTLVTEFIGVSLALGYFGVSPLVSVPLAAVALVAVTLTGSFRRWEQFMYLLVGLNLLVLPLVLMVHPDPGAVAHDTFVPGVQGGLTNDALLLIISIVGTTVAPWQLFFQQSNVVDKRITPRWITYERLDTIIGSVVTELGAAAVLIVAGYAFASTDLGGHFTDAGAVAAGLARFAGPLAGGLFAIFLLDASIIGAAAVTLATSYAFGDVFGIRHSLHRGVREAKAFYVSFAALVLMAAGVVLIPNAPLGLITLGVQALAGVLLPGATVFLLLLCNDRDVLGPWTNGRSFNILAIVIVGVLLLLSMVLVVTTLFPELDVTHVTILIGLAVAAGLCVFGALEARGGDSHPPATAEDRDTWRMPPLALLDRPRLSGSRKFAVLVLRGYLTVAVLLLVLKVVQLAS